MVLVVSLKCSSVRVSNLACLDPVFPIPAIWAAANTDWFLRLTRATVHGYSRSVDWAGRVGNGEERGARLDGPRGSPVLGYFLASLLLFWEET